MSLRITQGGVSSVPSPDDKEPEIETDCRIGPGTVGGPLCNQRGAVVGMIYKRSAQTERNVDPFGLALPAETLQAFLKKNLPASETPDPKESADKPTKSVKKPGRMAKSAKVASSDLGWDEVKVRLESSVVRVQCFE
jgi:S1-C subfamily serine protease